MNILITGATGFIGNAVIQELLTHTTHRITALTRPTSQSLPAGVERLEIDTINGETDYGDRLKAFQVIIHLAARVHVLNEAAMSSYHPYQMLNVDGTQNLASQAAATGVKRFIFLSSIKVNGESTRPGQPFKADDPPHPSDAYAVSKYEAERSLILLSRSTDMEVVIIRPPLVYGPGVKANFHKLIDLVHTGLPLPFGSINNYRSLVSISNLTSLIRQCLDHPNAANRIFLVSDDRDVSTTELIRIIADSMDVPGRLIRFPQSLLRLFSKMFGKDELGRRLLDNLQVDISKTKSELDWHPPSTLEEAIRQTTSHYLLHSK